MERVRLKDSRLRLRLRDTDTAEANEKGETIDHKGPDAPLTHTILNDKLIEDFCQLIEEGLPADSCCNYLGINPSTYWQWLRKGELFLNGNEQPPEFRPYGVFVRAFRKATSAYLLDLNRNLHDPDQEKGWFRYMEILGRRDRRTWSRDEPAGGTEDQFDPDERFL